MPGPIALMTDFGHRDPFAGIMKGVIAGLCPDVRVVDLCHEITPGDVRAASFALAMAFPYFPEKTVFTVVVDPGVGGPRKAVAAEIGGRFLVCPDNGIPTWTLKRFPLVRAVECTSDLCFLASVSDTFHGRDVFAPMAARLACGTDLDELGPRIGELTTFPIPEVKAGDRSIHGEIVYVDHFGNLISNVSREDLAPWQGESGFGPVRIHIGSAEIEGIHRTYSDVAKGKSVAVFGSTGYLELAVNGGSAEATLASSTGSGILIYRLPA